MNVEERIKFQTKKHPKVYSKPFMKTNNQSRDIKEQCKNHCIQCPLNYHDEHCQEETDE